MIMRKTTTLPAAQDSIRVPASLRELLAHVIDYAGLFPPAALTMSDAVRSYAAHLESDFAWALGRFVLPASRLSEFELAQSQLLMRGTWRLSCLTGNHPEATLQEIERFHQRNLANRARVDCVEASADSAEIIRIIRQKVPSEWIVYCEVSPDSPAKLLSNIREAGARAKIRAGGLKPEAIPTAESIAGFLTRCAAAGTAFKATAGLHHPLRCFKPLTYEPEALHAKMHGFINVFLAAAFAQQGLSEAVLTAILESDDADRFSFDDAQARWSNLLLKTDQIRTAREQFAIAFGSCSFDEPLEDLRGLRLL